MNAQNKQLLKLAGAAFFVALVCVWLVFISGCKPVVRNTGTEKGLAPVSNLTREQAESTARLIALMHNGTVRTITPTGSMEPIVDSRSFIVLAPHKGDLRVGMVVSYYHSVKYPSVLHKVVKLNDTHFTPDGITNRRSDGWIPRENITGELIAVIYARE
ncbi:MAG: hypothetical protein KIT44_07920 [Opitutaceae bacterium]|nr:hypothetical protein [Opitutaceae bacterium]